MNKKRTVLVFARLASEDASDGPKWVQVARAGTYRGYAGGELEFTLDRAVFEQVIANLRRHPAYTAGPDGIGSSDVIAWDFNHASEHSATSGSLPVQGAPAQGWVLDLEVRQGADGVDELWALTRWLEPARSYIKEGRYRWASISIVFNAVDPVSGAEVGALLTSIALTNTPFIEGMQPLAASREGATLRGYFFEPARTPADAIGCFKQMLGLPTLASDDDVVAELAKLRALVETGASLPGENLDEMVSSLRTILGLPALTSVADVFAKVGELFTANATDSGRVESGLSQVAPSTPEGVSSTLSKATQEDEMELLKLLAAKLGCKETETAVLEVVSELVELRDGAKTRLGADKGSTKAILDKVDEATETISASKKTREALEKILKAAGVEDAQAGIEKIAELMESAGELKKLMPELERLKKAAEAAEEKEIEDDVAAAMASRNLDADMKEALILYRRTNPEAFGKKYPKVAPEKAKLAKDATSAKGEQDAEKTERTAPAKIDLSSFDGRNKFEKARSYLSAQAPGFKDLSYDEQMRRAFELAKQEGVTA